MDLDTVSDPQSAPEESIFKKAEQKGYEASRQAREERTKVTEQFNNGQITQEERDVKLAEIDAKLNDTLQGKS